jgi:hypothetical protein
MSVVELFCRWFTNYKDNKYGLVAVSQHSILDFLELSNEVLMDF